MSQVCFGVDSNRIRANIITKIKPTHSLQQFNPKIMTVNEKFIYSLSFTFEEFQKV